MDADKYRRGARLFHVLSHAARLQILDELRRRETCVCHLQAVVGRSQPYISQQLRVLREAGVIENYRDGPFVFYRLADDQVARLLEEVLGPARGPARLPVCSCPCCREEPSQVVQCEGGAL